MNHLSKYTVVLTYSGRTIGQQPALSQSLLRIDSGTHGQDAHGTVQGKPLSAPSLLSARLLM